MQAAVAAMDSEGENTPPPPPATYTEQLYNHLYFYGEICERSTLDFVRKLREVDMHLMNDRVQQSMDELAIPFIPILLHINSRGGEVFDTLSIVDTIKSTKSPVYSIVEGMAASGASLIAMSCSKRFMRPSAVMLVHEASGGMYGSYGRLQDAQYLIDMIQVKLVKFYVQHSKLTEKEIVKRLKHDWIMDAKECLADGFVDEIGPSTL